MRVLIAVVRREDDLLEVLALPSPLESQVLLRSTTTTSTLSHVHIVYVLNLAAVHDHAALGVDLISGGQVAIRHHQCRVDRRLLLWCREVHEYLRRLRECFLKQLLLLTLEVAVHRRCVVVVAGYFASVVLRSLRGAGHVSPRRSRLQVCGQVVLAVLVIAETCAPELVHRAR